VRALIIAGGAGTRLRPLTYRIPKPVIPVVNKPLVQHQIEFLKKHGIREIILSLYYLAGEIKKVLGDGSGLGVKLFYSVEKKPLGTGGAVKKAAPFFKGEPLIVLNGDIITELALDEVLDFYHKNQASLVLVLTPVEDPTHYGLVVTSKNGRIEKFLEKPSWDEVTVRTINAGTYVMNPEILNRWLETKEFSFERELFPRLVAQGGRCFGFVNRKYWMDLGSPVKYLKTHFDVMKRKIKLEPAGKLQRRGVWVGEGSVFADEKHSLAGPAVVGRNCRILSGAVIEELVTLGDQVVVGANSRIEKSVLLSGVVVGRGAVIKNSIIGAVVLIEDEAVIENAVVAHASIIRKGSRISGEMK
jgi:mannose-1-phosphate guanylyltransferase/phosphomannomutase